MGTEGKIQAVELNINQLKEQYFTFDEPVPYELKCKKTLKITPIKLKDSYKFSEAVKTIAIDKNSISSAEIISMSYLQFVVGLCFQDDTIKKNFVDLLDLCLGLKSPAIRQNEMKRYELIDRNQELVITAKEFEDIRRIILYQNLPKYDDEYINPDLKKAMEETDELRNRNIDRPDLERKMAIITAHCGISKQEQIEMTMRSHSLLFEEVCGEVEFTTVRPVALIGGKGKELDHWIFKKKSSKFDKYITERSSYESSMGGESYIRNSSTPTENSRGNNLEELFNNFK